MKRIATLLLPLLLPALICAGGIVPEPASMTPGKGNLKISGAIFKCDPSGLQSGAQYDRLHQEESGLAG